MSEPLSALIEKFESLPQKVGLSIIRKAGRRAAALIRDRAEELAPVDTGKLQGSIVIRTRKEDDTSIEVEIGPTKDAWYGQLQEFGTAHHPGQPFLGPAVDAMGPQAGEQFAKEMFKEIEKALKKHG